MKNRYMQGGKRCNEDAGKELSGCFSTTTGQSGTSSSLSASSRRVSVSVPVPSLTFSTPSSGSLSKTEISSSPSIPNLSLPSSIVPLVSAATSSPSSPFTSTTTPSPRSTDPTPPKLQIAVPISTTHPILPQTFFPLPSSTKTPSSNTNLNSNSNQLQDSPPQGLGPQAPGAETASRESGIVAGILVGVLLVALLLAGWLYKRWRRKRGRGREHRSSIGGLNWGGSLDEKGELPISWRQRGRDIEQRGTLGGLRWFGDKNEMGEGGREDALPGRGYGSSGEIVDGATTRPLTFPDPAFSPLRSYRSSSVYSSSILNFFPPAPPQPPKRGHSTRTREPHKTEIAIQRSTSEPQPRTPSFSHHHKNPGRGRPISESQKTIYTIAIPDPDFWEDEKETMVGDEMSVFSEQLDKELEEMRKGYKGRVRWGMGVQRRLAGESVVKEVV